MPAINFSVFKDKLVKGLKRHTIRKAIPKGWKVRKPLSLYTGMRTKGCHKLVDTFCGGAWKLEINYTKKEIWAYPPTLSKDGSCCFLDSKYWVDKLAISKLAKNDGFESVEAFWEFFKDYSEPCYLLHFNMQKFTPTQWALEALEKGVLK